MADISVFDEETATGARLIGAADVGGSHVSVALVDAVTGDVVPGSSRRVDLDPQGAAGPLLEAIGSALTAVDSAAVDAWGLAVPGPFDYRSGVALYQGVGKFDALYGVDVRAALGARIHAGPDRLTFLNDADAFALGEWFGGAVAGVPRCVGLTLGSGIGSAFLADGRVVEDGPTVPLEGSVHHLQWQGCPLEDTVSRRALRAAYSRSHDGPDVAELADLAREGDLRASEVFDDAFFALGVVLAPWMNAFAATDVVLGGSISRSWDLVVPPFLRGLGQGNARPRVLPASRLDEAAFLGAALSALRDDEVLEPELAGELETA